MKVVVVGNIGSGKTTLALSLASEKRWPLLSIDDCRRRFSDGSRAGEEAAWVEFLRHAGQPGDAVLEFSGSGSYAPALKEALGRSGERVVVFWVVTPPEACLQRLASRSWDIPYPDFRVPLEEVVPELHARLHRELGCAPPTWPGPVVPIDGTMSPMAIADKASQVLRDIETGGGLP